MKKFKRNRDAVSSFGLSKGISLPINALIVIAIAVVALVTLGALFFSSSFSSISSTDTQRVFGLGCARYCKSDLYSTFQGAYEASKNDQQFVAACQKLGYGDQQHVNRCLQACVSCNLIVTETDLNQGYDNLVAQTTRG